MKEKIYELIKKFKGVSFAELEKKIEGFKGDLIWENPENNLVFWSEISEEAFLSLKSLLDEKRIKLDACPALIYLVDGVSLSFPIAKRLQKYKKPHWVPIVFNPITEEGAKC